ncbi:MAG: lysozyme inhibitor LprI family protein [Salibacteraceae bacterium]
MLEFTAQLQKEKEELSPADRFAVDTFRIEKQLKLSIEADYSRNGMMLATYKALDGYDDLLNQYYQALINQLTPEDQSILKKAQRHWLAYRDAEIELNRITTEDQYTGGGSIHLLVKAHRNLEITKQRVIELQAYLMRTI